MTQSIVTTQSTPILSPDLLQKTLHTAVACGADFAEVFVEDRRGRSLALEDGRLDQVVSGVQRGVGVRVIAAGTTAFAFTEAMDEASVLATAKRAADILRLSPAERTSIVDLTPRYFSNPSPIQIVPGTINLADKIPLLERADKAARAVDPHITQVTSVYFESHYRVQIANSYGVMAEDERCRVRVRVQAVATREDQAYQGFGSWGPGSTGGYEAFAHLPSPEETATEAARQALVLLDAGPAPAGRMALVITNGVGGILFHEACGHGLEGDVISSINSVYSGRRDQLVASPAVTAVDDGTISGAWGSSGCDDEGNPCQRTVLINEGRLQSYLYDDACAKRDQTISTGNGRRASFRHLPMPRMTNTYIAPGPYSPEQIIAATDYGLFARNFSGGVVDIVTGTFTFTVREGYLIRNGRLEYPVRDIAVVGNGPEVLQQVDMVGNDLALMPVICGKEGQKAMVCVGQPTLRVAEVTVGGAKKRGTNRDEW